MAQGYLGEKPQTEIDKCYSWGRILVVIFMLMSDVVFMMYYMVLFVYESYGETTDIIGT